MRRTITIIGREHALRAAAAIALTGSLALFGCSSNKMPGNGEPGMSAPAAGSVAPNATSTPGSSSGSTTPQPMISSSPAGGFSASEDAIATLKADQAYQGKVLGQATPGDNSVPSESTQQQTGQFAAPAATPEIVASSPSSYPPPAATNSGVAGALDDAALYNAGVPMSAGSMTPAAPAAIANGASSGGSTAMSNTTATAITNAPATATAPATNRTPASKSTAATASTSEVRVTTSADGSVVVTNDQSSTFQRFLSAIGIHRVPITADAPPATSGTTPTSSTTATPTTNQNP